LTIPRTLLSYQGNIIMIKTQSKAPSSDCDRNHNKIKMASKRGGIIMPLEHLRQKCRVEARIRSMPIAHQHTDSLILKGLEYQYANEQGASEISSAWWLLLYTDVIIDKSRASSREKPMRCHDVLHSPCVKHACTRCY
jgi:hypothetical protein